MGGAHVLPDVECSESCSLFRIRMEKEVIRLFQAHSSFTQNQRNLFIPTTNLDKPMTRRFFGL